MVLFKVDGWDLPDTVVAGGDKKAKPSNRSKKRERNRLKSEVSEEDTTPTTTNEPKSKKPKHSTDSASDPTENAKLGKGTVKETTTKEPTTKKTTKGPTAKQTTDETTTNHHETTSPNVKLTPLQQKMMAKLSGLRFRWINEQLYTTSSDEAFRLLQEQPLLFKEYHDGFRLQVLSWPENPVNVFVSQLLTRGTTRPVNAPGGLPGNRDKQVVVADMGCGEAQLALEVEQKLKAFNANSKAKPKALRNGPPRKLDIKVHSFDLHAYNPRITVADIKNVPLPSQLCNIVIFCLALMGTNFLDFIAEAHRILAPNGELWIAEIKSRFSEQGDKVGQEFEEALKLCGFFHKKTDNENKMFTRFEFFKPSREIEGERNAKLERKRKFIEAQTMREKLNERREKKPEGQWLLKPCIYKRR